MSVHAAGLLDALERERALAVIRAAHVPDPAALAQTIASSGISTVELTLTTAGVLRAIGAMRETGAFVGAGTVLSSEDARRCIAAGAQYLVSPAPVEEVTQTAHRAGIPVLVGALTPAEVLHARRLGAGAVKLFPARVGGPAYVRDLLGPFPDVLLVPSGGIDAESALPYLAAGALAVSTGGATIPADLVERGDLDAIAGRVMAFVHALHPVRERAPE